jgi:hypothetical protein
MDFLLDGMQPAKDPNEQAYDTEKKELIEREFGHCRSLSIETAPLHSLSLK